MSIKIEHPSRYESLKLRVDLKNYVLKYQARYNNFLNLLRQYNQKVNPTFFISPELLTIDEIVTIVLKTHQAQGLDLLNVLKRTTNEFTTYDVNQLHSLKYANLGNHLLKQLSHVEDMKQVLECYVHKAVNPKKLYQNEVVQQVKALRKLFNLESVSLETLNDQISSKLTASSAQFKNQRIYLYRNTFVNQWGFWVNPKLNPVLSSVYHRILKANDGVYDPPGYLYDSSDTVCCIPLHELSRLKDGDVNWMSILLSI